MDFSINPLGTSQGYNPLLIENQTARILMIITRLAGATLVVPVMEELFKLTIPLTATDLPAGVIRDLDHGRQPPHVSAKLMLAAKLAL
jgi:hypothetical protein